MTQNSAPEEWSAPVPKSAEEDRFAVTDSPPTTVRTRGRRPALADTDETIIQPGRIPAAAGLNPTQYMGLRLAEYCVLVSALMSLGFLCWALWELSGFFGEALAWSGTGFSLLAGLFLFYSTFCRFTTLRMTALGVGAHLALVTLIYGLFAFLQLWAMAGYRFQNAGVGISLAVSVVALVALMSASRATRWQQRRVQFTGSITAKTASPATNLNPQAANNGEPGWGSSAQPRKSSGRRSNKGKVIFMQIASLLPLVVYGAWLLIWLGDQALFYGEWRSKLLWCGLLLLVSVYIYGQLSRFWTARIFGYGASIAVGYLSFLGFGCGLVLILTEMSRSSGMLDSLLLAGFFGLVALVSIGCSYAAAWRIGSHITAEIQRHIPLEPEEDILVEGGSWDEAKPAG